MTLLELKKENKMSNTITIAETLIKDDKFFSKESFELYIEKNRKYHNDSYIDTIVYFCEENEVDEDEIVDMLSKSLLLKITSEANKLRLLKEHFTQTNFNDCF